MNAVGADEMSEEYPKPEEYPELEVAALELKAARTELRMERVRLRTARAYLALTVIACAALICGEILWLTRVR